MDKEPKRVMLSVYTGYAGKWVVVGPPGTSNGTLVAGTPDPQGKKLYEESVRADWLIDAINESAR